MRAINTYYRDMLKYEREGDHYAIRFDGGGQLVSEEGMRQYALFGRITEEHVEALDAVTPHLGRCPHGLIIDDEVEEGGLSWRINDYVCDPEHDPESVLFILSGWHGDEYCVPFGYHVAGVVFPW